MTPDLRRRLDTEVHLVRRATERQLGLSIRDLDRFRDLARLARPAFITPGQHRYRLRYRFGGEQFRVVYDSDLDCLVTIWRVE
jgi:hypothetical protein